MLGGERQYTKPANADNITMDDILLSCPFSSTANLAIDCGRCVGRECVWVGVGCGVGRVLVISSTCPV
jgi:hypothetical protein